MAGPSSDHCDTVICETDLYCIHNRENVFSVIFFRQKNFFDTINLINVLSLVIIVYFDGVSSAWRSWLSVFRGLLLRKREPLREVVFAALGVSPLVHEAHWSRLWWWSPCMTPWWMGISRWRGISQWKGISRWQWRQPLPWWPWRSEQRTGRHPRGFLSVVPEWSA